MVNRLFSVVTLALLRRIGAAGFVFVFLLFLSVTFSPPARAVATGDDRGRVVNAIHDAKAALAEITDAERNGESNPDPFRRAAQRAINALVGRNDSSYVAKVGTSGDEAGAIGDLNAVLDRRGTFPWTAPLDGAVANLNAAVQTLQTALKAHGLMKYEVIVTDAVQDIEMVLGRPSETGPLGGLEGVLSSTELGVPPGAHRVSACTAPTRGPVYGVYKGYLAYVALPLHPGETHLPQPMGEQTLTVTRGLLILRTPAAATVAKLCRSSGREKDGALARSPHRRSARVDPAPAADPPGKRVAADPPSAAAAGLPPAVYTLAQAQAGKKIFMSRCIACHGKNLQGVSAPAVAGKAFLDPAKENGWSIADIQYVIATAMPFNAPGTLTQTEQANVLAFILAKNCYPSGTRALSANDAGELQHVKLGPVPGARPSDAKLGTCAIG